LSKKANSPTREFKFQENHPFFSKQKNAWHNKSIDLKRVASKWNSKYSYSIWRNFLSVFAGYHN
jgi:hypothetical protein